VCVMVLILSVDRFEVKGKLPTCSPISVPGPVSTIVSIYIHFSISKNCYELSLRTLPSTYQERGFQVLVLCFAGMFQSPGEHISLFFFLFVI